MVGRRGGGRLRGGMLAVVNGRFLPDGVFCGPHKSMGHTPEEELVIVCVAAPFGEEVPLPALRRSRVRFAERR